MPTPSTASSEAAEAADSTLKSPNLQPCTTTACQPLATTQTLVNIQGWARLQVSPWSIPTSCPVAAAQRSAALAACRPKHSFDIAPAGPARTHRTLVKP